MNVFYACQFIWWLICQRQGFCLDWFGAPHDLNGSKTINLCRSPLTSSPWKQLSTPHDNVNSKFQPCLIEFHLFLSLYHNNYVNFITTIIVTKIIISVGSLSVLYCRLLLITMLLSAPYTVALFQAAPYNNALNRPGTTKNH